MNSRLGKTIQPRTYYVRHVFRKAPEGKLCEIGWPVPTTFSRNFHAIDRCRAGSISVDSLRDDRPALILYIYLHGFTGVKEMAKTVMQLEGFDHCAF